MGDGVAVARVLAAGLGELTRDRLAGGGAEGLPDGIADVDGAWLGRALGARYPGLRIERAERVDEHAGTSARARVRLHYAARGGAAPPASVFVKIAPPGLATRLFTGVMELGRNEARFYRELRPSLPIEAPAVHFARAAARGPRFALVLEDLVAAGCTFPGFERPLGLDVARAVVSALARLHAAFWESPRFGGDLAWLEGHEQRARAPLERWLGARSHPRALAKVRDGIPDSVRRGAGAIHRQRARLEAYWARPPRTLLHGDTHVGNLYLRPVNGAPRVGLLDWQVLQRGPGIRDVGYFLVSSLDSELRRAHERELVELYLSQLSAHGVSGVDRDATWQCYRTVALYTWIAAAVTVALGGLQADAVGRLALRRAGAAIEDLDALGALHALPARGGR